MKDLRKKAGLICTRPFEWLEIHRDGHSFLCCPAWVKKPVGNLLHQPLAEIWNSPRARETRKACSNGSFHLCSARRCPHLAAERLPVQRLDRVQNPTLRDAIARGRGRLEFGPRRVNLCHDQSCNLAFIATLQVTGKLSFVVQQNNWREIPAFIALARRFGFSAYLSQMVNWGTFSREEFRRRAVHLPEHPEYPALRRLLDRVGKAGDVDFGNLRADGQ